ncbi:MAG: succinylglutamate desuccinylase [Pseudomonadales bacterium]|nr:succinylglutamate desuccinylase [Pseudomonadales bacterium]
MRARTEYLVLGGLTLGLLSFFFAGQWFAIPTEPEPLPEALTDISHLEPQPLPIVFSDAQWRAEKPIEPIPDVVALIISPPERLAVPSIIETDAVPEEDIAVIELPQYTPVAHDSLDLEGLAAGTFSQLNWGAGETMYGASIPTPILVAKGETDGPTLCVTAAVHGDELNGIESVRELMYSINTRKLKGTLIGVPIVNIQGFQRHSRYLSDRRDLNRFFPGNPRGSVAGRMAHSFFHGVIKNCDKLVDLHTGSFHRTNLPQLRADLHNEAVVDLTKGFGTTTILHSSGGPGTLRRAASDVGIPSVTLEAGEPLRLQEEAVEHTVKAIFTLMDTLKMYSKRSIWGNPEPTYYSSRWIRADQGGILLSRVKLGRQVKQGTLLGTVTDPITNERVEITAPFTARVIGMAVNQFVMPGYATFHLAAETDIEDVVDEPEEHELGVDVAAANSMGIERSE